MPIARFSTVAPSPAVPRGVPGAGRRVDFIAFVAAKLNATPAEIAAARGAAAAMRSKLDGLVAGTLAAPADGLLPFPPFEAPTPAVAPADAVTRRRYTRTAV